MRCGKVCCICSWWCSFLALCCTPACKPLPFSPGGSPNSMPGAGLPRTAPDHPWLPLVGEWQRWSGTRHASVAKSRRAKNLGMRSAWKCAGVRSDCELLAAFPWLLKCGSRCLRPDLGLRTLQLLVQRLLTQQCEFRGLQLLLQVNLLMSSSARVYKRVLEDERTIMQHVCVFDSMTENRESNKPHKF